MVRAQQEIRELEEVDRDLSGTLDQNEFLAIRAKGIKISKAERMMELFTTHPNMLKRIKHLASLV